MSQAGEPTFEGKIQLLWDERQILDVLDRYSRGFAMCDTRELEVARGRTDLGAEVPDQADPWDASGAAGR